MSLRPTRRTPCISRDSRVLLVELNGGGHRFYHVRTLARDALDAGAEVALITQASPSTREHLELHLAGLLDPVEVIEVEAPTWRDVESHATRLGADLTVVPESDGHLLTLMRGGWRGPGRLSLLVMRTKGTTTRGRVRELVGTVVKALVVTAALLLPRVHVHVLRSQLWRGRSLWPEAHDPAAAMASAADVARLRSSWQLDPERYWFGILGSVSPNKNADVVARAIAEISGERPLGLLVAGNVSPAVAEQLVALTPMLESAGVAVRMVDRLLDEMEFDAATAAIDCLVLAYHHNGPSGTLGKAMMAGTRIVAAGSPALRRDARAAPGNVAWSKLEPAALARNLREASTLPRPAPLELPGEHEFTQALLLGSGRQEHRGTPGR